MNADPFEGKRSLWFFWHVFGAIPFLLVLLFFSWHLSSSESIVVLAIEPLPFPDHIASRAKLGADLGLWRSLSFKTQTQAWDESNAQVLQTWRKTLSDPTTLGVVCTFSGHQAEKLFRFCLRFHKPCISIRPLPASFQTNRLPAEFQVPESFGQEFSFLLDAMPTKRPSEKLAVFYSDDSFGKSLLQEWKQSVLAKLPVSTTFQAIPVSTSAFPDSIALSQLTEASFSQLWILSPAPWNCLMARHTREAGISVPIMLVDGNACRAWNFLFPPDDAIFHYFSLPDQASITKSFSDSFRTTFRTDPDIFAFHAFRVSQSFLAGTLPDL